MMPPYIGEEVKSAAEKKIYARIKDSKNIANFACLHSLALAQHIRKRQGEIDFVLVGDGFVLCLEVKGGRVERKDGFWHFTDRYGITRKKSEGPIAQVSSAMHSLRTRVDSKFHGDTGFIFGYGVLIPDINFTVDSPEWDQEIIYDLGDATRPFEDYVQRLKKYWLSKNGQRGLKVSQEELVEYLRGDFEIAVPLWKQVADGEEVLLKFTQEQYRALDRMEENKRILFTGCAGTGKTLLALEKSRRAAFEGKSVLLLCFNRFLGAKLKSDIQGLPTGGGSIAVDSIHKYFSKTIRKAGLQDRLHRSAGSSEDVYGKAFIEVFIDATQRLSEKKFDVLVVDEGQDLLNVDFLSALDQVLEGGLKGGEWAVFLDPGIQARLFNRFSLEAYQSLKSLNVPEYKLDINCRNTLQIATQTEVISGFSAGVAQTEGAEVEYIFCPKDGKEESLLVVELLKDLIENEKIRPRDITVLSTKNTGKMSLLTSRVKLPSWLVELDEESVNAIDKVTYASVQSFKGLENKVIIYTDVEDLEDKWCESVNYVGMSRARQKLYIFLPARLETEYQQRLLNFAKHG